MKKEYYSTSYRWMHWLIAISLLLLLFTIFLRFTWMNKQHMAAILSSFFNEKGWSFEQDELIVLAKKLRHPMWIWHIYIGYFLVFLFSIRFMLPLFGKMKFQLPWRNGLTVKERLRFGMFLLFYVLITASLVTGLFIEWGPKEYIKSMEAIHKFSIYYLLAYMAIHLFNVFYAELTNDKGLISKMISGGNKSK